MRQEPPQISKEGLANSQTLREKPEQTDTDTRASEGHLGKTLIADTVSGASVI